MNNEQSRSYNKNVSNTLFVSNFNVAANLALPLVITSPHGFLNLLDVSEVRYYLARSADGERLMITFEQGRRCSYGLRDPPDILHDQNGLLLREYRASDMLVF